jgi:transposase
VQVLNSCFTSIFRLESSLSFSRENLSELSRHLVDIFVKLKQYQATATRYDKRATNFLGAIYLAATVVWLN